MIPVVLYQTDINNFEKALPKLKAEQSTETFAYKKENEYIFIDDKGNEICNKDYDSIENGDDIEGTIVEIRNEKDEIIDTGLTDEEGRLKIKELPSGKYCFVQKEVKEKYLFSNEKQCISIDDSKKLWKVSFVNKISKRVVDVPDTLENIPYFLGVAIVIIVITIGGFFYQKVHFRN